MKRVSESNPSLGRHLAATVRTGSLLLLAGSEEAGPVGKVTSAARDWRETRCPLGYEALRVRLAGFARRWIVGGFPTALRCRSATIFAGSKSNRAAYASRTRRTSSRMGSFFIVGF